MLNAAEFQVIHGDLCLGNILFDSKTKIIKLIDPRGRFGEQGIFGDVYYELAKMSHSFLGLYDFIMTGQFRMTGVEEIIRDPVIRFRSTDYHDWIGKIFLDRVERNGYDIERVRISEALLFLSMLPLHSDSLARQKALYIRGVDLLMRAT